MPSMKDTFGGSKKIAKIKLVVDSDGDPVGEEPITLPDGKKVDAWGWEFQQFQEFFKKYGITHVEWDGSMPTNKYGDLKDGEYPAQEFVDWIESVQ